ncbi:MAG TPA: DUF502 domain-containing protein [Chlamydiales bacterium]|nr:DUF502 domain-containing protein [Chlamydiales bacterium]
MFKKYFIRGLFGVTPLVLTLVILIWLFKTLEGFFRPLIEGLIGETYYFPGLGIVISIILIFIVGLILSYWLGQAIYEKGEKILEKIPVVRMIYTSFRDIIVFFEKGNQQLGEVVKVSLNGIDVLGFVTVKDLSKILHKKDYKQVAVYVPLSYQIGGVTIFVDFDKIEKLDMTTEEGMRFAVSAGIISKKEVTKKK